MVNVSLSVIQRVKRATMLLRGLKRAWRATCRLWTRSKDWLVPLLGSLVFPLVVFGLPYGVLRAIEGPVGGAGAGNLGAILGAQAAMTAIFLAAMIFIVEAVHRREDLDDPLYELFLRKSWARWVFCAAVWLFVGTAGVYLVGPVTQWSGSVGGNRGDILGLASLVIAALIVLAFLLRALHVLRPTTYPEGKREVIVAQARAAVRARGQGSKSQRLLARIGRTMLGEFTKIEDQANRAVDRVADDAHRAIANAHLTDVLEAIATLESVAATVASEMEVVAEKAPDALSDQVSDWPTYGSMNAGVHRLMRAAYSQGNPDIITPTSEAMRNRLEPSVKKGNDLFVAVILNVIHDEQDMPDRRIYRSGSHHNVLGLYGIFSRALRSALSATDVGVGVTRRDRIARNMIAGVHAYGVRALVRADRRGCGDAAQALFGQVEVWLGEPTADGGDVRVLLRRASLAMVGLALANDVNTVVQAARNRRVPSPSDLYDALREDALARYGVISELSTEWLLATGLTLRDDENIGFIEERSLDFVRLGYMWLIVATEHDNGGHWESHQTLIRQEFSEVWLRHRRSLVSAFAELGSDEYAVIERWCDRVFS